MMRRTLRRALACALVAVPFAVLAPAAAGHDRYTVSSPDRSIVVEFELDGTGRPLYSVSHDRTPLLTDSTLGLQFADAPALDDDFDVRSARQDAHDSVWRPVWGEYRTIRNRYRELTIDLREDVAPRRSLQVVFRVFDDGVAFRYVLPRQRAIDEFAIAEEDTEFRFAGDFTAWWIPAQFGPGSGDEHLWRRTALSAMEAAATPVTVDAGRRGLRLRARGRPHRLRGDERRARGRQHAAVGPGRAARRRQGARDGAARLAVADARHRRHARELVESTMIVNLNDPCAICRRDTSWIEPGKYVGVWWEIHKGQSEWATGAALPHGATTENVKRYIDLAASHGADHVLAEGWNEGWADRYTMQDFLTPTPDLDLEEVAAYARSKGVRWMAHNETGGNASNYMSQIEPAFSLYERLGVRAVKTGYAGDTTIDGVLHNHYDQAMVNHYRETIRIAARHHLMVEAHEMVKDTGERRTYPNIMTREAVRGIEWEAWSEGNPPEHLVNIPFTRMLSGPVSYTPGIFDTTWDPGGPGRPPWRTLETTRVHSTRAAQMAIYPVYLSGLQMMADVPEHYEGEPELEFLEQVPTTWDDTKAINGRIGDHVTVARRSGQDWFVGSLTDEQDRTLSIPLRFLDSRTYFVANVYGDAPRTDLETNPDEVRITRIIVDSRDR